MKIQRVKLKELEDFVKSDEFINFKNKPISVLRVNSYIHNPNALDDDVVLYLAFKNNELVGYKNIWADTFLFNVKKQRFGWFSGTWTHPEYRRKGVSLSLFIEVFKDWKGKLMYTNYAESSKAVYDKSEKFELLKSNNGYRHYLRFCFKELLPPKSIFFQKNKKMLGYIDVFLNFIFDARFKFLKTKKSSSYKFEEIENWDTNIEQFLKPYKENELFKRDKELFDWIEEYPWVKTDNVTKVNSKAYYFSSYANRFDTNWYKIYDDKTNHILGVIFISIKNQHLKIPYIYTSDEIMIHLKNWVVDLCYKQKISYITIYNDTLNDTMFKQKGVRIVSKKFTQNYYVTKELINEFSDIKNHDIQSGDGDVVFT